MRPTWRAKRSVKRFVSYSDLDSPSVNSAAFNPSRMLSRPRSPAIARLLYRLCASIVRLHDDGVRKDRFNRLLQRMLRHVRIGRRIKRHKVCGRLALAAQHTCDSCQQIGKAEVLPPVTNRLHIRGSAAPASPRSLQGFYPARATVRSETAAAPSVFSRFSLSGLIQAAQYAGGQPVEQGHVIGVVRIEQALAVLIRVEDTRETAAQIDAGFVFVSVQVDLAHG